jgi:hypothetical protein
VRIDKFRGQSIDDFAEHSNHRHVAHLAQQQGEAPCLPTSLASMFPTLMQLKVT